MAVAETFIKRHDFVTAGYCWWLTVAAVIGMVVILSGQAAAAATPVNVPGRAGGIMAALRGQAGATAGKAGATGNTPPGTPGTPASPAKPAAASGSASGTSTGKTEAAADSNVEALPAAPVPGTSTKSAATSDAVQSATHPAESASDAVLGDQRARAIHHALIGQWTATIGNESLVLAFEQPNLFTFGQAHGTFAIGHDATLILSAAHAKQVYLIDLAGPKLTLTSKTASELRTPIEFIRQPASLAWIYTWFRVSPRLAASKLWHVLVIIIIVIIAQLILAVTKRVSYLAVFTDKGVLGKIYNKHQNRARTIHLLILNLIKYAVYLAALGIILAELGVNIGAYLVSLSVVGLAIGFGSQDLVRDMVTGFFVLFESQYDVGDMVDVGGQTGVVTEIGLRMTRLRNYLGQTMVIPNRSVAVVGNYLKGAQAVSVDVQLEGADEAGLIKGREVVLQVAEQIRGEFAGVVIEPPAARIGGDGESDRFLRLELSIWPGQSWLIDTRLVPQLRESLVAAELKILGDRIIAFYHAREIITSPQAWHWKGMKKKKNS